MASRHGEADRRSAIADAAIVVLSDAGVRGLSHRAVDRQLALPDGSTSYYFRTRAALMAAAAERLVALDMADVSSVGDAIPDVARLLAHWMAPAQRVRLLARFQLFVEAARSSEIRKLLEAPRKAFVAHAARSMRKAGAPDAKLAALMLVATIDGLLLNQLIGEHVSVERLSRALPAVQKALSQRR